jgi:hypothetical protein
MWLRYGREDNLRAEGQLKYVKNTSCDVTSPSEVGTNGRACAKRSPVRHRGVRMRRTAKAWSPPRGNTLHPKFKNPAHRAASFRCMRLADRIAQCCTPFLVQSETNDSLLRLNCAADFAKDMERCPTRYVLSDDLTRLCTALAYSKGARNLACADLLRVPSERVWVEWCESAWLTELQLYGFESLANRAAASGRRGVLIRSTPNGRRGLIRTFWSVGPKDFDLLASSMEAYFDLDTEEEEEPVPPDNQDQRAFCVSDAGDRRTDILRRCFRFRYERSWADYYRHAMLTPKQEEAVARHALGTIAADIPVLLAFFLLLSTRTGLPRRTPALERLNRSRARAGKHPLLDHIEVLSPVLREPHSAAGGTIMVRRPPRLHHVRGHLVRRGSQLFWRLPHLRGNARSGVIRTRTVTWTVDRPPSARVADRQEPIAVVPRGNSEAPLECPAKHVRAVEAD